MKMQKMRYRTKIIQATYRAYKYRIKFKAYRKLMIRIQKNVRKLLAKVRMILLTRAGRLLNRQFKKVLQKIRKRKRDKIRALVMSAVDLAWKKIQDKIRRKNAIMIQKFVRCFLTKKKHFKIVLKGRYKR
jgi:hypothetical protein